MNNLLKQNVTISEKNNIWCTDFTYMRVSENKFKCNYTIIDLYDRSVITSINNKYINTDLAIKTLTMGLKQEHNPKGIILHSNQEIHFTSYDFVMFCKRHGIIQSMSKADYPYDNTLIESILSYIQKLFLLPIYI